MPVNRDLTFPDLDCYAEPITQRCAIKRATEALRMRTMTRLLVMSFLALAPFSAHAANPVFPTTLSGAVAPTANSGSVQATLLNKLTFPVGRSSTNPADQTVYGLVIDSSGNLHVTVSGAATQFSTTITVTNTGGASAVFAPNWPGYVASNATLTTSIFSQTCAVGNSGGATIVCDPNAAQVDITFG